jgi:cytochrome c-type biogenesis protein CcmH
MRRRASLVAALALLAFGGPAGAATPKTTLHVIEQQVMCVTCNVPLQVAESPAADDERTYISGLIAEGLTVAKIKAQLVKQYGVAVLALPPVRGFNVVFYVLPIAIVIAALAIVAVLVPRWRRRSRASPATAEGEPLSSEDAARLDADLAAHDI